MDEDDEKAGLFDAIDLTGATVQTQGFGDSQPFAFFPNTDGNDGGAYDASTLTLPTFPSSTDVNVNPLTALAQQQQADKASGKWECEVCSVMNTVEAVKCASCETDKPGAAKTGTSPVSGGFTFGGGGDDNKAGGFTFGTTDTSAKSDDASMSKPSGFTFGVDSAPMSGGTNKLTALAQQQQADKASGKWECEVCSVVNDSEAIKCASCETDKPGSTKAATTGFTFGGGGGDSNNKSGGFTFGAKPDASAAKPSGFTFGAPAATSDNSSPPKSSGFAFGTSTATADDSSAAKPFMFGASSTKSDDDSSAAKPSGFTFGASTTTADNSSPTKSSGFTFGTSTAKSDDDSSVAKPSGFTFGASTTKSDDDSSVAKPSGFTFGTSAAKSDDTPPSKDGSSGGGFTFGADSAPMSSGANKLAALAQQQQADKASGKWECEVCSVVNESEAFKCASCETDKPGSTKAANTDFTFGSGGGGGGFTFGAKSDDDSSATKPSGFTFGTSESTAMSGSGFTFGASTTSAPRTSSTAPQQIDEASNRNFTFGTSAANREDETTDGSDGPLKVGGGFKFGTSAVSSNERPGPSSPANMVVESMPRSSPQVKAMDIVDDDVDSDDVASAPKYVEDGEVEIGEPTMVVPELPMKSSVGATWGFGNQLLFFSSHGGHTSQGRCSEFRWSYYGGRLRAMLHHWHGIFSSVQNRVTKVRSGGRLHILHDASKRYRAEIQSLLETCAVSVRDNDGAAGGVLGQNDVNLDVDKQTVLEDSEQFMSMLEYVKSIWHLCEIFFLDPNQNATAQIMDWYHHSEAVPTFDGPSDSESYWRCVYRMVLHGRTTEAVQLLRENVALMGRSAALTSVLCELLQSVPSIQNKEWPLEDFIANFRYWRQRVDELMVRHESTQFSSEFRVFHILLGEVKMLEEYCESWYELLVAQLLYTAPDTMKDSIQHLAEDCYRMKPPMNDKDENQAFVIDVFLWRILHTDVVPVLQSLSQLTELEFVVAHLADLLHHGQQLLLLEEQGVNLRRHFLLEYGVALMGHKSLWQVAATYFGACGRHGTHYLRTMLLSRSVSTDAQTRKVVDMCRKWKLNDVAQSVMRQRGARALRSQKFAAAMYWFVQCNDAENIRQLCVRVLNNYLMGGGSATLDIVDAVSDHIAHTVGVPEAVFLAKFRDLCFLQEEIRVLNDRLQSTNSVSEMSGELQMKSELHQLKRESLEIVVRLVVTKLAPRHVWLRLLWDALPFLDESDDPPLLSVNDTREILACIESVRMSHHRDEYSLCLSIVGGFSKQDVLNTIGLTLTHHLSRAIMYEASYQ